MSMTPNDPFDDPQNHQTPAQSPPPAKSYRGCLIGCGVAGFLGLLVCCGGGLMLTHFGIGVLASEYERQLAGNPVIVEHIGEIESLQASWSATISEAQKSGDQGSEAALAFEVKGSKGSGTLLIQQDQGGGGVSIKSATLVMPDGTRHPIDVATGPDDDLDLDLGDMFDPGDLETGEIETGEIQLGEIETGDVAAPDPPEIKEE